MTAGYELIRHPLSARKFIKKCAHAHYEYLMLPPAATDFFAYINFKQKKVG